MPHRINIEVGTSRKNSKINTGQHRTSDIWPKTLRQVCLLNFYPQCSKVATCLVPHASCLVPRALHAKKQQTASRGTAPGHTASAERAGSELPASIKHKQDNKFISIICYIISRPPSFSLSLSLSRAVALARFDFKICHKT